MKLGILRIGDVIEVIWKFAGGKEVAESEVSVFRTGGILLYKTGHLQIQPPPENAFCMLHPHHHHHHHHHININLFRDDCIRELDLHRFRDFLLENHVETGKSSTNSSAGPLIMDILMKDGGEGNEQDLEPFDPALLKPLQNLPPGKLPGISFDAESQKLNLPTSIFSSISTLMASSAGNSPKRRKVDPSQQNITIQHF